MKSIWKGVLAVFVLGIIPGLFTNDSSWYMTTYCQGLRLAIVSLIALELIPNNRVALKTCLLVFSIYTALEAQFYFLYVFFDYNVYSWSYLVFSTIMLALYLLNRFKQFNFKSDKVRDDWTIYLCFWKPKNGITLTASLIGLPFGGLSIYCKHHLYGFRWGYPAYMKQRIDKKIVQRAYTCVDTGVISFEVVKLLDSLVGTPAGRPRIRCISTIAPVLKLIGEKFTPRNIFDLIPSHYATRIL